MAEIQKYSLMEELRNVDTQLHDSPSLLGMTMLTYPNYINSMRSTMFTSHLKQFLNLKYPQFPFVFTNTENLVGKYSSGYKKAPHDLFVFRKIAKFDDILEEPKVYKIFVFDKETQTYDVIERKVCEDLTENFGYDYINDVIDTFKEGDEITKVFIIPLLGVTLNGANSQFILHPTKEFLNNLHKHFIPGCMKEKCHARSYFHSIQVTEYLFKAFILMQ